ncbi:UNVERIFIED_ORG: tetratricopeptide (TPR) repeat protein [Rhizobium esperanzae]
MISLRAFGRFRLVGEQGEELTPKSAKSCGIIALLALAPDFCRSRAWLQDKLWSDRSPKQASDSLRQSLMDLRRSFGAQVSVLHTDRERVSLDPRHFVVSFDWPADQDWADDNVELFGDLDIADAEFEGWIRDQRSSLKPRRRPFNHSANCLRRTSAPCIFLRSGTGASEAEETVVRQIFGLLSASLLDLADFQIFQEGHLFDSGRTDAPAKGIAVEIRMLPGCQRLSATITHPREGRVYWSHIFKSFFPPSDDQILAICSDVVEAILDTIRSTGEDLVLGDSSTLVAVRGRQLIFRFGKRHLLDADAHFKLAYDWSPRPQYLAWRAFLRNIAQFQHRSFDFLGGEPTDVEDLSRAAAQQAPSSAIALGIASHIEYLRGGSHQNSLELATRAVSLDPLNAINHAILSNTELAVGNYKASSASSLEALALAAGSEYRAFVEFFCCMSAAALGEYQVATNHAEMAVFLNPLFLAPLRYLVALYRQADRFTDLQRTVARIRTSEPDFHMKRLLDAEYPVTTLRRMRLIEAVDC